MKNKFELVIFDMDGVMVDSELYWSKSNKNLWRAMGVKNVLRLDKEALGLKISDIHKLIKKKYNPKFSELQANKAYNRSAKLIYTQQAHVMPGVKKLIEYLHKKDIPMAIASSSPRPWIELFLGSRNLKQYFGYVVSTQSNHFPGKPNPAIYKHVIKRYGIKPQQTLIIEDTTFGLQAAKASGAQVIAVPDRRWSYGDFSKADLVAKKLTDKRIYKLLGL